MAHSRDSSASTSSYYSCDCASPDSSNNNHDKYSNSNVLEPPVPVHSSTALSQDSTTGTSGTLYVTAGETHCKFDSKNDSNNNHNAVGICSLPPDTKVGQSVYLHQLITIISAASGYNGFSNLHHLDGSKITYETFFDADKLTPEFVHRIIILLLVKFHYLPKSSTINGLLFHNSKPLPGDFFKASKTVPPMIDVAIDDLHKLILETFFTPETWPSKHYDTMILITPELDGKKVRAALAYFTHFCIHSLILKQEANSQKTTQSE